DQSPYAPQAWDQMTLVALALAAAKGEVSGTAIKDNLRAVSNPPGTAVYSYAEGAKLLQEGKKINYEGASGSCDFDQIPHDLPPRAFRRAAGGKGEARARHDLHPLPSPWGMPPTAHYVFNGVGPGATLALPAVAFSLLWRLLRFPNFAVSTYLTVGAYVALV